MIKWTKADVINAFQTGQSPLDLNNNGIPDATELLSQLMVSPQNQSMMPADTAMPGGMQIQ